MFLISFTPMLNLKTNIEIHVNDFIHKTSIWRKCGLVSKELYCLSLDTGFFHRMKKGK